MYLFSVLFFPVYLYTWRGGGDRERYQVSKSSPARVGGTRSPPTAPAPARPGKHSTASSPGVGAPPRGWSHVCQLRGLRGRAWPGVPWRPQLAHGPDSPGCNLSRYAPGPQAWRVHTAVSPHSPALERPLGTPPPGNGFLRSAGGVLRRNAEGAQLWRPRREGDA